MKTIETIIKNFDFNSFMIGFIIGAILICKYMIWTIGLYYKKKINDTKRNN